MRALSRVARATVIGALTLVVAMIGLPFGTAGAVTTPVITDVYGAVHPGFGGQVIINGTNFEPTAAVTFSGGITGSIVGTPTATQIRVNVTVPANVAPAYYDTTVNNGGGFTATKATSLYVRGVGGQYHPLTPSRILDTRPNNSLAANATRQVAVLGVGGVPTSGVSSVVLNVTAVSAQPADGGADGYLTVYPTGGTQPTTSTVNFLAGQIVANAAISAVGTGGQLSLYNFAGKTDVIFDIVGYYSSDTGTPGSVFVSRNNDDRPPYRIMDTRSGQGVAKGAIKANSQASLLIADPQFKVTGAALNVTAINSTDAGYLTVSPSGENRPEASSVNFTANTVVPNHVIAKTGTDGKINIYNYTGTTDAAVDLFGWFFDASVPWDGGQFTGMAPRRVLDTRSGQGGVTTLGAGQEVTLLVNGTNGIPADAVTVVFNVTVVNPSEGGFLTVWQSSLTPRPNTSNVNFVANQTVANLSTIRIGAGGTIKLYNSAGNSDVLLDVVGYYR
ncbi:MAG: hypothetical protein AB7L13_22410 [Acidimicrobiia bacterium]